MRYLQFIVLIIILIAGLCGCNNLTEKEGGKLITEEQAISIVKSQQENNNSLEEIDIISVDYENGEYKVVWERESNCENGIAYVNDQTGITHGTHSIC